MNVLDQTVGEKFALYHGDSCEVLAGLPEKSVDYSIFSPPFASLFVYSNSPRDLGNVKDYRQFGEHFGWIISGLKRVMRPGRNVSIHCMDLPTSKERHGYIGLFDFRGALIRAFEDAGFIYHSQAVIWKDPVTAMQRTKALGLLHKTVRENASMSRQGIPDYLLTLRAPGQNEHRVTHTAENYPVSHWQKIASPIWTDIDPSDTLQYLSAREHDDERHICLARGSLVLTKDGFKPIETVSTSDEVLTHKGRWRKVLVAKATGTKPVVALKAQGVAALTLTPDHKVWARKPTGSRPREAAEKMDPSWVEARESVGGYVNQKLPPIDESIALTEQECWILGRWLADGHVGVRGDFFVSVGAGKHSHFEEMAGDHAGFKTERTATQYRLKALRPELISALESCGKGASNKQIPGALLSLKKNLASSLLAGYLSGDGHFVEARKRWMATSVSRALLLGLSLVVQRVYGTIASIHAGKKPGTTTIQGRTVNTKQEWVLSFETGEPTAHVRKFTKSQFVNEDGAWKSVRSADPVGESEVWCLRVEEDESFTAEGCIVKNCPLQLEVIRRGVQLWTNPGDTVLSPFAGIGSEGYVSLQEGRRFVGCELKASYYQQASRNLLEAAASRQQSLFRESL